MGVHQEPPHRVLEAAADVRDSVNARCTTLARQGYGLDNTASMAELFASFIVRFMVITRAWVGGSGEGIAVSAYDGKLVCADEALHDYVMIVEDPFDSSVNTARTIRGNLGRKQGFGQVSRKIGSSFERTAKSLAEMSKAHDQRVAMHAMVTSIFGAHVADGLPPDTFVDPRSKNSRKQSVKLSSAKDRGEGGGPSGSGNLQRPKGKSSRANNTLSGKPQVGANPSSGSDSIVDRDSAELQVAGDVGQEGGGAVGTRRHGGHGGTIQPRKGVATGAFGTLLPLATAHPTERSPVWSASVQLCRNFHACTSVCPARSAGFSQNSLPHDACVPAADWYAAHGMLCNSEKAYFSCMQPARHPMHDTHRTVVWGEVDSRHKSARCMSTARQCRRGTGSVRNRAGRRLWIRLPACTTNTVLRM